MPIEVGIWRLGKNPERISMSPLPNEKQLEDSIANDISILDPNLLVIGRQVPTSYGKFVDLLTMDADGKLVVIELKRDRTPRDVIAQVLDYGSWVRELVDEDIAQIFHDYKQKYSPGEVQQSLDDVFCQRFSVSEMPELLNDGHELVVVASELDVSTERIVGYLADEYGVAINAVYFRYFKDGDNEYMSRVWLIDPGEAEAKVVERRSDEPWNGEFYVSFGEGQSRHWSDAISYGYISAGGGIWYSRTLSVLEEGGRIWVNVPGRGYVGVGRVLEKAKPINEFTVQGLDHNQAPIRQMLPYLQSADVPIEDLEYFVSVEWIKTIPLEQAIREKGFFGNQNSAARPRDKKWAYTVERLKTRWGIAD